MTALLRAGGFLPTLQRHLGNYGISQVGMQMWLVPLFRSFFLCEDGMWREEVVAFLRWRGKRSDVTTYTQYWYCFTYPSYDEPTTTKGDGSCTWRFGSNHPSVSYWLTNEDTWKARWVGRVVDDDSQSTGTGEEKEEDRAAGGQLEVLYG